MAKFDKRGNPVSYGVQQAIDALDHAFDLLHAYQADPLAEVDKIIVDHPAFAMAHAFRAGALATATDKAFEPELLKSVAAAEALAPQANDRERMHISAVRAWLDGDWERAIELWGRASIAYPRDLLALQYAHVGDFFLGYSHMLRDRVARVLPHWNRNVPGYGFIEGMYAFGLEEAGDYEQAEARGREAVALNRQDGWAVHAVTHVLEMQGRAAEGADYLAAGADAWAPNSMFAFHLWWHKALFHLDANDAASALKLFDEKISAAGFGQALELLDGSALLWRLSLLGHDVGDRWNGLAEKWQTRIDDAYYAFNDVNAMMAFVGAGNREAQSRQIETVKAGGDGHRHQCDDEPRDRGAGVRRFRRVRSWRLRAGDRVAVAAARQGQSLWRKPRAARHVLVDTDRSRDPHRRPRACRCIRCRTSVMEAGKPDQPRVGDARGQTETDPIGVGKTHIPSVPPRPHANGSQVFCTSSSR